MLGSELRDEQMDQRREIRATVAKGRDRLRTSLRPLPLDLGIVTFAPG
jgi:hypothetical protein